MTTATRTLTLSLFALVVALPVSAGGRYSPKGAEKACTIAGKIRPRCMELAGFPQPGAPAFERTDREADIIQGCYASLRRAFETKRESLDWYQLNGAADFVEELATSPTRADDPATKDCLALADELSEGVFTLAVSWDLERKRIGPTFDETFKAACGIRDARIVYSELGTPIQVLLEDKPKKASKKVALENAQPPYTIRCDGSVTHALPDGTELTKGATYRKANAALAGRQCMRRCETDKRNERVCGSAGTKASSSACRAVCVATCD